MSFKDLSKNSPALPENKDAAAKAAVAAKPATQKAPAPTKPM